MGFNKVSNIWDTVSFAAQKINNLLKFKSREEKIQNKRNWIKFLVSMSLASTLTIEANHCKFDSTHWFSDAIKWSLSKNVWGMDNWNDIEKVYVQKWWKTASVSKKKLKINATDKIKVTKSDELCILWAVDYNFMEFSNEGLLDYVKELSEKYEIDYRYVLSVMH